MLIKIQKTLKRIFVSIMVPVIAMIAVLGHTPVSFAASKSASSQLLTASAFAASMKTGWNLGNSLDAHYKAKSGEANLGQETVWGNPKVTKELLDFVRSQGFDVIRIPVTWSNHTYTAGDGNLHVHPDWLARVKEVVDTALSSGFYVILDTHHDGDLFHTGVSSKEFESVKATAAVIWTDIAAYFSAYDNRLIFESFNEVDNYEKYWQFGKKAASQMNELNQVFVNTVRGTGSGNAERILMVPTLLDNSGEDFQKAFILPKDTVSDRLLVTVHFYNQQFDQGIESGFERIESFSKNIKAPIIIGEWGTKNNYSPSGYRAVHASNYMARANAHGIKCIYWDNGSDYALIDRKNLTANTELINAIMNPAPHTSDGYSQLSSFDKYLYMTINQDTGELREDTSWGSLVVNADGNGAYPIPSDKKSIYTGLHVSGSMNKHRLHYLYFFDANGNLTGKVNNWNGFTELTTDIPAGSTYVRIGLNSAYSATSKDTYKKAVETGDLSVIVNFY